MGPGNIIAAWTLCVPVWGVSATHRLSRFDRRLFDTQQ